MDFDFKVELPKNWEQKWGEVEGKAKEYNISLRREGGKISINGKSPLGKFAAKVLIDGDVAFVKIIKKPMLITKSSIKNEVKKALKRYG